MIYFLKNINKQIAPALLLLGLFCFDAALAQGKKITIRHADRQEYRRQGSNDLVWLVGNVVYEHDGAIMNCDSSIFYRSENRFKAFGNVTIKMGDSLNLLGNQVTYEGNSGLLDVTGNVFLNDGNRHLQTEKLVYNRKTNTAAYTNFGTMRQEDNVLTSKMGFYNSTSKMFNFRDSVRLNHPKYNIASDSLDYGSTTKVAFFLGPTTIKSDSATIYCERGKYDTQQDVAYLAKNPKIEKGAQTIMGDSIFYRVKLGEGEIFKNAYLRDTANNYLITGGYARYIEVPEYALVTDKPLYSIKIEEDSLFITGDTLVVLEDTDNKRKVRVFRNSKFFKPDFQGKSDSLIYTQSDSTFQLYHNPVVWNEGNQLTADIIFLTTKQGKLDSLNMLGNAFLISLEDSTKFNQIKGRNMYGKFFENELRTIYVQGNGQTVYYAYDDKDLEIGVNRADCSNLIIRIKESRVDRVTFLVKPDATLYPSGQIPAGELFLKGFNPRYKEKIASKEALFEP